MNMTDRSRMIVGPCVGSAFARSGRPRHSAGQSPFPDLAPNADMFPGTHGRQVMLGNSAPKALRLGDVAASGAVWWVTTAAVAILIAVFVLHRHLRSHHLRSRVRFDLLPTAGFDPSPQAVLAFAHQLGRVRPVRGWVPRAAVGVRVRFSTDPEFGKMVMSVEGRESVTGVLNKLVYPDVEIRRATSEGDVSSVGGEGDVSSPSTGRQR
ncbi:hypothetical protein [Amycolatopsis sp. NPDC051371]|uniref:hypothetical protein n=1 Tax=Amycolatopsis sp. NPDC051371 TaxID=3155800 RepID=UPI00342D6C5F